MIRIFLLLFMSSILFAAKNKPAHICAGKLLALSGRVLTDFETVQAEVNPFIEKLAKLPISYRDKDLIKKRLALMVKIDQEARNRVMLPEEKGYSADEVKLYRDAFWSWIIEHDRKHIKELKKILKNYSWIKVSEFGPDADYHAWLLVQHAVWDVPFQKRVLAKLKLLYPRGETLPKNYAYLFDRVAELEGRVQRYGTQGQCTGKGQWDVGKVENASMLNEWRKKVGLSSIEEYIKFAAEKLCK